MLAPAPQAMHLVALGPSVPTGPDGITADVVEVAAYDELQGARRRRARQDRALQSAADAARAHASRSMGARVAFRGGGAVAAAKAGAVAVLVRSAGTGAYRLPHTGGMRYDDATPKIPAAAVSAEDAESRSIGLIGARRRARCACSWC